MHCLLATGNAIRYNYFSIMQSDWTEWTKYGIGHISHLPCQVEVAMVGHVDWGGSRGLGPILHYHILGSTQ